MRKAAYFFLLIITVSACKQKPTTYQGYSKENNFYYKLVSLGEGKKPDSTQTLLVSISCKTLSDSLFWDSQHNSNQALFISKNSPDLLKDLYRFSPGDSLQYLFPTKDFFTQMFNSEVPFFCEKDSCIKFSVKILRTLSPEEHQHVADSLRQQAEQQQDNEFVQIQHYVTQNMPQAIEFDVYAFMQITQNTQGDSVKKDKKIYLWYEGYFIDGTLVDHIPDGKTFDFICGQEGQILPGLQQAIYHMKKGEEAKIILPSHLTFGQQGSSNGNVPPYTPMVYKIKIVDIK